MKVSNKQMKLTKNVMEVLKSFSTINPSILIKSGNQISTISSQKTILATAKLDVEFPSEAAIYNLSRFISMISLFDDPEIIFEEHRAIVKSGTKSMKYVFAAPEMINTPSKDKIDMPSVDISFDIPWEILQNVMKGANILSHTNLAFIGTEEGTFISSFDLDNQNGDEYKVKISDETGNFKMIFKMEHLKLLPDDYSVEISKQNISKFQSENVTYWIAVQKESEFK